MEPTKGEMCRLPGVQEMIVGKLMSETANYRNFSTATSVFMQDYASYPYPQ